MGWIFWVIVAAVITALKVVVPMVKSKLTPKELKVYSEILEWKQTHLYSRKRKLCYVSDTGNAFVLGKYEARIKNICTDAEQLVKSCQERLLARRSLSKALRKDPMLDRIQTSFFSAMEQYHQEMMMFQFDRLDDAEYTESRLTHLETLLSNANTLMQHFGDYMLSLSQAAAADSEAERELIEAAVQGMEQAVAAVRDDIEMPATPAAVLPESASAAAEEAPQMMQSGE